MGTSFQLNKLFGLWTEAQIRDEPTIAFEISIGKGRFLFAMFFDPEDKKTKDQLLLFLQNTRHMLPLTLYGSHSKGVFQIYLKPADVDAIKRELQLEGHGEPFEISAFIDSLNAQIPNSLPLAQKIDTLRTNMTAISGYLNEILDFAMRTELIGERQLPPNKKPREKTLRKLYLYSTNSAASVAAYIAALKKRNRTLSWRVPAERVTTSNTVNR
ncbi:MAG: hypothetical protein WA071_14870 [Undibacterium umbellatum]|uniref:hypothetical protein n=1 Tax=Undibacterium umbellatum TaxID=2762300 RepID=UPI003BB49E4E